jgi:ABC-2 type transport system ATP-binding protein
VRVRTPASASLADALSRAGIQFSAGENETVLVYGTTSEQVGDIAFAANVPIHELVSEGSSLEEVFLGLTEERAA